MQTNIFDREGRNYAFLSKGLPRPMSPVLMNRFLPYYSQGGPYLSIGQFCLEPYLSIGREQYCPPFVHYLRYADDMLIGLKPGCPISIDHIVSCIQERMSSIGQALKVETFGRGQRFLALGVLVEIGREGSLRLTAPLDRISKKMWAASRISSYPRP